MNLLAIAPMRDAPSPELVELLDQLGVSPRLRWRSVTAAARGIAGNLPLLDSVWLDALVRLRHLSPYQARELASGRGPQLLVGPHLVRRRLPPLGYAEVLQSAERTLIRARIDSARREPVIERLTQLRQNLQACTSAAICPLDDFGIERDTAWVAMETVDGIQAADWMVENGRFPPRVVMHIARQMLIGLCELERHGETHGDLRASCLFIERNGEVRLAFTGLRDALPVEGGPATPLPPECYESLSPERARENSPATIASDLFACGCLWWHLLTGRPAIPGGNSAAKRENAIKGIVPDVRLFAPDVPEVLADLIASCTRVRPESRPRSFAEMTAILGPPSEAGTRMIADCLRRPQRWVLPRPKSRLRRGKLAQLSLEVVAVSACLLVALLGWRLFGRSNTVVVAKTQVAPATAPPRPAIPISLVEKSELPPDTKNLSENYPSSPGASEQPGCCRGSRPDTKPLPATPVSFQSPIAETTPHQRGPEPLRLPEGRLVRLASLNLEAGQRVCGEQQGRVRVQTPAEGLLIEQADVCFEKIDFVAHDAADAAMLRLAAATATFVDCTFRGPVDAATPQPAIRWESSGKTDEWDPTADLLELTNCLFDQVAVVVERERDGAASLAAANVLLTRSAGFLRILPTGENAALRVSFENCTLRDTGPVVCYESAEAEQASPDKLLVSANDSVFAVRPTSALIEWRFAVPAETVERVKWSGRDSLLTLKSPLLAIGKTDEGDSPEPVDDAIVNVVGLGRSPLSFAEDTFDTPAASRLRRWVAARKSPHPPGIIEKRLPPGFGDER